MTTKWHWGLLVFFKPVGGPSDVQVIKNKSGQTIFSKPGPKERKVLEFLNVHIANQRPSNRIKGSGMILGELLDVRV